MILKIIENTKIELTAYKIEEDILSFTTVVPFKNLNLPASYGKFLLHADAKLLNYIYKTGIGSRRSEGFGMFEIIRDGVELYG